MNLLDIIAHVEKWLNTQYENSPLARQAGTEKLARIVQSAQSDDEKITALKKEFPAAFSDTRSSVTRGNTTGDTRQAQDDDDASEPTADDTELATEDAKALYKDGKYYYDTSIYVGIYPEKDGNATGDTEQAQDDDDASEPAADDTELATEDADALYKDGKFYYETSIYEYAVKFFRKAAELGHAEAQYLLGRCYYFGWGVKEDDQQAVEWYRNAAEQGHADARMQLGDCYNEGKGVIKNRNMARYWWNAAAEGNPDLQFSLARQYQSGDGFLSYLLNLFFGSQDAVNLFRKAAEKGHASAQYELAECYFKGKGVEKNFSEAQYWYGKAADHLEKDWKGPYHGAEAREMARKLNSFVWCAYHRICTFFKPILIFLAIIWLFASQCK